VNELIPALGDGLDDRGNAGHPDAQTGVQRDLHFCDREAIVSWSVSVTKSIPRRLASS
jgi:hypothetical protein